MKAFHSVLAAGIACACLGDIASAAVVFHDDMESASYTIGSTIMTKVPPVGAWVNPVFVVNGGHTIQANPLGSGKVIRSVRTTSSPGFPSASSLTPVQANTDVTITWDAFRADRGSWSSVQALYMGTTLFTDSNVSMNLNTEEITYHDGTSSTPSGVFSGSGGWERFEMVISFGPVDGGGLIYPTFDLYFERLDASNSRGILAKTQIANDVDFYAPGFTDGTGHMRWIYAMNEHQDFTAETPVASTVYFDNIQISTALVPEPASLGVLAAAGLTGLGVRRRA